jgi:hypothetical protein
MSAQNGSSKQFRAAPVVEVDDEDNGVEAALLAALASKTESNVRYIHQVDTELAKLVANTAKIRLDVQTLGVEVRHVASDVQSVRVDVEEMAEKVDKIPTILEMLGTIMTKLP